MKIRDLLDELKDIGESSKIEVGEILAHFEGRSLGVLLVLLAIVNLIPLIGGIPGMPVITGTLIIIIAVQSFLPGKSSIWLPQKVSSLQISREKVEKGVEKAKPWFGWLDNLVKPRLKQLVNAHVAAVCSVLLALAFFPLGFIPWAVSVPALAIVFLGLALVGKDGIVACAGYGVALASLWMVWRFAPGAFDTVAGFFA